METIWKNLISYKFKCFQLSLVLFLYISNLVSILELTDTSRQFFLSIDWNLTGNFKWKSEFFFFPFEFST